MVTCLHLFYAMPGRCLYCTNEEALLRALTIGERLDEKNDLLSDLQAAAL
jgi:hypothetical protein